MESIGPSSAQWVMSFLAPATWSRVAVSADVHSLDALQ